MKIAIVGAGAMGSLIGGQLAKSGEDVWLVDVYQAHIDKIKKDGLAMKYDGVEDVVRIKATTDPGEVGTADVVLLLVKGVHTDQAMQDCKSMLTEKTYVITLQNGVGNVEKIKKVVPEERIIFGLLHIASTMVGLGAVDGKSSGGNESIKLRPVLIRENDQGFTEIVDVFNRAKLYTKYSLDVENYIWAKLALNTSFNGVCAITRLPLGKYYGFAEGRKIAQLLLKEVVAVANAKKISINYDEVLQLAERDISKLPGHYPTLAQDFKNKRATEIDFLNGAVMREGERLGIPVPVNTIIYNLVKVMENSFDDQWQ